MDRALHNRVKNGDRDWSGEQVPASRFAIEFSREQERSFSLITIPYELNQYYMAQAARFAADRADVVYHGTRYANAILASKMLRRSIASQTVSVTRSPESAAHWALLERDDDEERGAILVLDRASLHCRYQLRPFADLGYRFYDEMEEVIPGRDLVDLPRHLIAVIREPMFGYRSPPRLWPAYPTTARRSA